MMYVYVMLGVKYFGDLTHAAKIYIYDISLQPDSIFLILNKFFCDWRQTEVHERLFELAKNRRRLINTDLLITDALF